MTRRLKRGAVEYVVDERDRGVAGSRGGEKKTRKGKENAARLRTKGVDGFSQRPSWWMSRTRSNSTSMGEGINPTLARVGSR